MPTVLIVQGFRFFFWSNKNDEPIHIHIEKGGSEGKTWLEPQVKIAYLHGFSPKEQKIINHVVTQNVLTFKEKWNEYFAQ